MIDSLYEKALVKKNNINARISSDFDNPKFDPSKFWRKYRFKEDNSEVTICAGDGSINKKNFMGFIFYVIDAECLIYNNKLQIIESSEIDIIPHHHYVDDRRAGQQLGDARQRETALVPALGEQHRQDRRGAGEALGGEPQRLLLGRALARHVVGGDHVDRPVGERLPQRGDVVLRPERRIGLAQRAQVRVLVVGEVVRAGLDPDVGVARAPAPDLVERHPGGDVREVDARAQVLGEAHRAHAGLGLGERRLRAGPVLERGAALGLHPPAHAIDELDVLGVADDGHACRRARPRAAGRGGSRRRCRRARGSGPPRP